MKSLRCERSRSLSRLLLVALGLFGILAVLIYRQVTPSGRVFPANRTGAASAPAPERLELSEVESRSVQRTGTTEDADAPLDSSPGLRVTGKVMEFVTMRALANVRLEVSFEGPEGTIVTRARSGASGKIGVSGPVSSTRFSLKTDSEEWLSPTVSELVDPGATEGPHVELLVLRRDARVQGFVRDMAGAPIPGAWVRFWSEAESTDSAGRYSIAASTEAVTTRLEAGAPGYGTERYEGPLSSEMSVDFVLRPQRLVRGTVRDLSGEPLPGVRVRSLAPVSGSCFTDELGRFELGGFSSLSRRTFLRAEKPGYARADAWLAWRGGSEVSADLQMGPGREVSGFVSGEDGIGIGGARVVIDSSLALSSHADEAGFFTVSGVPFQSLEVFVDHQSHVPLRTRIAPHDDLLRVTLVRGSVITGRIVDPTGGGVQGANVVVRSATGPGDEDFSDARGQFAVRIEGQDAKDLYISRSGMATTVVDIDPSSEDQGEITLSPAGRLWGRLHGARDGAPVRRFRVRLVGGLERTIGAPASLTTVGLECSSETGSWSIPAPFLSEGDRIVLEFSGEGYAPAVATAVVGHGPVEVMLDTDLIDVSGSVVCPTEHPLPSSVEVFWLTGRAAEERQFPRTLSAASAVGRSDSGGGFSLAVPPGLGVLVAESPDHGVAWSDPITVTGPLQDLTIWLPSPAVVLGCLTDRFGAPLPGVPVKLEPRSWSADTGPREPIRQRTDDYGCFRFAPVSPGRYAAAWVDAGSGASPVERSFEFHLGAGERYEIEPGPGGASAVVTVTGADAFSDQAVCLRRVGENGVEEWSVPVFNGAAALTNLPLGRFEVALTGSYSGMVLPIPCSPSSIDIETVYETQSFVVSVGP